MRLFIEGLLGLSGGCSWLLASSVSIGLLPYGYRWKSPHPVLEFHLLLDLYIDQQAHCLDHLFTIFYFIRTYCRRVLRSSTRPKLRPRLDLSIRPRAINIAVS